MTNEIKIKTTGTIFDVDDAMAELSATTLAVVGRLDNLYASVHPAIVWNTNASVKEAMRISAAIKTVIDNLNTEVGLTDNVLDREINRLDNLYASVHPAIVWNTNASVKEAMRISSEIEFIKNKLIKIKTLIHEIDAYYDETE